MLMLAKQEVHSAQYAKIKNVALNVKNEVMEMIAKVRERKGRLDLPIVSGNYHCDGVFPDGFACVLFVMLHK